ncbi:ankyrin repeat-containing domain protein [Gorgonomyces haynaldii]|nr:ankyrin repeat-containing domain protein [Gorgonomyces haynaldii]
MNLCKSIVQDDIEQVELILQQDPWSHHTLVPWMTPQNRPFQALPLNIAVLRQNKPIVSMLLEYGANPVSRDSLGRNAMQCALSIQNIDLSIIKLLLDNIRPLEFDEAVNLPQPGPWGQGVTLLGMAASKGPLEHVKLLLEAGADPEVKDHVGLDAIVLGARSGRQDVIDLLHKSDKLVHIFACIKRGNVERLKETLGLLKPHILNQPDKLTGVTPLLYCVRHRPFDSQIVNIFQALLDAGSDPCFANVNNGKTLLHYICKEPAEHAHDLVHLMPLLELAIKTKVNVNAQDSSGNTALHYCCRWGQHAMVEKLIESGCNISIKNNKQKTAIEECTNFITRKLLLEKMNGEQRTPTLPRLSIPSPDAKSPVSPLYSPQFPIYTPLSASDDGQRELLERIKQLEYELEQSKPKIDPNLKHHLLRLFLSQTIEKLDLLIESKSKSIRHNSLRKEKHISAVSSKDQLLEKDEDLMSHLDQKENKLEQESDELLQMRDKCQERLKQYPHVVHPGLGESMDVDRLLGLCEFEQHTILNLDQKYVLDPETVTAMMYYSHCKSLTDSLQIRRLSKQRQSLERLKPQEIIDPNHPLAKQKYEEIERLRQCVDMLVRTEFGESDLLSGLERLIQSLDPIRLENIVFDDEQEIPQYEESENVMENLGHYHKEAISVLEMGLNRAHTYVKILEQCIFQHHDPFVPSIQVDEVNLDRTDSHISSKVQSMISTANTASLPRIPETDPERLDASLERRLVEIEQIRKDLDHSETSGEETEALRLLYASRIQEWMDLMKDCNTFKDRKEKRRGVVLEKLQNIIDQQHYSPL